MISEERIEYFMDIATLASKRSKCLSRNVGAVLVSDQFHILAVGYNGPPKNIEHCSTCKRTESGKDLHLCYAVHAEANALLQCKEIKDITYLFSTHEPCQICMTMLLNTPCKFIYYREPYPNDFYKLWLAQDRELIQVRR